MYKNILFPASMLAGTIIGAGIFSLPFVFQRSGLLSGFLLLVIAAFIYALIYFVYSDIIVRTDGEHRLVGYAKMYLGNGGFWGAVIISLIQLFFVLTIYLILAPSFTQLIIGGDYNVHFIFFWLIASFLALLGTKKIAGVEFFIVTGILLIISSVFFSGAGKLTAADFYGIFSWSNTFFVIGPVLFALSGVLFVPEVVSYFKKADISLKYLKKSLLLGSLMPAMAYAAFILGTTGLSKNISENAVSGLIGNIPTWMVLGLGVLGFLSLISSYALVGLNAKHSLEYDFSLNSGIAGTLIVFVPILIYISGFKNFISTVSFMGSVFVPLEIIFLIIIWWRMDRIKMPSIYFSRKFLRFVLPFLFVIFLAFWIYLFVR